MRYFRWGLYFLIVQTTVAFASPAMIVEELANFELKDNTISTVPNPKDLHPMWWTYFDAEDTELQQHIQLTINNLQSIYATLNLAEQNQVLPLINKISKTLQALPQAKQQESPQPEHMRPFLTTYSLENQIELHQQIRKLHTDIKNEQDRYDLLKSRLAKVQQHVDNMMAAYVNLAASSSQKLLSGLEIIAYGANIGVGQHKIRLAEHMLELHQTKLKKLEEELIYSKEHVDVSDIDEKRLENNIVFFQKELDKKQNELAFAESNLLAVFNNHYHDLQNNFIHEQQVLQATVARAYAWSQHAFHTLKYNLLMHLNNRFEAEKTAFRDNLNAWKANIMTLQLQSQEWKKLALRRTRSHPPRTCLFNRKPR